MPGVNVAYIYPDFKTALVGTFKDGVMDFSQVAYLKVRRNLHGRRILRVVFLC